MSSRTELLPRAWIRSGPEVRVRYMSTDASTAVDVAVDVAVLVNVVVRVIVAVPVQMPVLDELVHLSGSWQPSWLTLADAQQG
jgi:hypothetical protein